MPSLTILPQNLRALVEIERERRRRTMQHAPPSWHGDVEIRSPDQHPQQKAFIESSAKRKVVRAGRRGGKTVGVAILALRAFMAGRRVLYATPTQDQIDRFWEECKRALRHPIESGALYKNETRHIIEVAGTEQRIRAKTAWDADTLRGDYADILILDEYHLMQEEVWDTVGAPMLLDHDGDAIFIYTPPSLRTIQRSRAKDPYHAAKLYQKALADTSGRWGSFHFSSHDNPHISADALAELTHDMSALAILQEIMAEDIEDVPGALWTRAAVDSSRVRVAPDLARIVVGVDPGAGGGDDTGIVAAGKDTRNHGYIVADDTCSGDPAIWPGQVIKTYVRTRADRIVVERNNGGAMVEHVIRQTTADVDGVMVNGATLPISTVWASRGKHTRAEPVSVLWMPPEGRPQRGHMVGTFPQLENQCCTWLPGMDSPNNLDAMVWSLTELFPSDGGGQAIMDHYLNKAKEAKDAA